MPVRGWQLRSGDQLAKGHIGRGRRLLATVFIGLPDTVLREARDRIHAVIVFSVKSTWRKPTAACDHNRSLAKFKRRLGHETCVTEGYIALDSSARPRWRGLPWRDGT